MEGYCRSQKIYVVFVVIALCLISLHCKAQVTFSRDWNAGKRTADNPDLQSSVKSATALCHMLISQMRQLSSCESRLEDAEISVPSSYAEAR